jgi:hypothetical protein
MIIYLKIIQYIDYRFVKPCIYILVHEGIEDNCLFICLLPLFLLIITFLLL